LTAADRSVLLGDELRRETPRAAQMLRQARVARIVMVTTDRRHAAETIAAAFSMPALLPAWTRAAEQSQRSSIPSDGAEHLMYINGVIGVFSECGIRNVLRRRVT